MGVLLARRCFRGLGGVGHGGGEGLQALNSAIRNAARLIGGPPAAKAASCYFTIRTVFRCAHGINVAPGFACEPWTRRSGNAAAPLVVSVPVALPA
jgi:hypothetical protein